MSAGQYLVRCVHPSTSGVNIVYFSWSGDNLESSHFNTGLVKERLKIGKRAARASNAHKLKGIMGLLLTTPGVIYTIPQNLRVNWGFNNDDTGKMLIPVEYFQESLINTGDSAYNMTAVNTLAYLYEDPSKYDPSKIFRGLLQGLFLTHKYGISQITEPHIVYTAIQVRFVFGSQEIWSGQDAMFDYEVFTNTLFELFGLDKTWTRETLTWWNVQIFGRSTGLASKTLRESLQREQLWREQLLRVAAGRAAVERVAAERAAAERAAAILRANTKDNELEAGLTSDANTPSGTAFPVKMMTTTTIQRSSPCV
ncbi:hypothetical protein EI94DRAFT_1704672 [Lactarius quietus]|nr:hypothetical protein EI94DRAFT_1704672 [Lactarius quietus]